MVSLEFHEHTSVLYESSDFPLGGDRTSGKHSMKKWNFYWEMVLSLLESMLTVLILTFFCHSPSHICSCRSFPVSSALPLVILFLIYSVKLQLFLLNNILAPWLSFFGSSYLLPQYLPLGDLLWYEKLLNSCSMKISPVLHMKPNSFWEHFYYFDPLVDSAHSHPELLV